MRHINGHDILTFFLITYLIAAIYILAQVSLDLKKVYTLIDQNTETILEIKGRMILESEYDD